MKKGYVFIGDNIFESLLAISSDEQQKGLMWSSSPPPVMSFVYKYPQISKFWMKNTPVDLDIVFIRNGKIREICHGEPESFMVLGADALTDLVIELPHGTIRSLSAGVGTRAGLL